MPGSHSNSVQKSISKASANSINRPKTSTYKYSPKPFRPLNLNNYNSTNKESQKATPTDLIQNNYMTSRTHNDASMY